MKALLLNNTVVQVEPEEFETHSGLVWVECSANCQPGWVLTETGLEANTQFEYVSTYADFRKNEYPSFADQFDLLYHGGYDAWKAAIDAVKSKYPKGAA